MFEMTQTFTHETGFRITPIEMQGVGFIFLPKELEEQLGYENLSDMVRQSDSFAEGIEYLILRDSKLLELKELLNRRNTIPSVKSNVNALIVLTESGLYTTMILSRKPNAIAFRRWVSGEILPSIRKTGMYKMSGMPEVLPELVNKVNSLERNIAQLLADQKQYLADQKQYLVDQKQFQQYALHGFDKIEAILVESLPHNMFEGWNKIKRIVDDMTEIYQLSDAERKQYFRELCHIHQVHLPQKALLESKTMFHSAQDIAIMAGIYSSAGKPHSRLVAALIRHLHLDREEYRPKFTLIRRGYRTTPPEYTGKVVEHIIKWLQENGYPETMELACGETGKLRQFKVKYR